MRLFTAVVVPAAAVCIAVKAAVKLPPSVSKIPSIICQISSRLAILTVIPLSNITLGVMLAAKV